MEYFNSSWKNIKVLAEDQNFALNFQKALDVILASYAQGGKLFIAGNGGSAADAQHISAELVAKLSRNRTSIPAFALTVDTSLLTAIGNDYGYDDTFSRQVDGLVGAQDVFLAITTSGNSSNIIKALKSARQKGAKSILLTGKTGGKAKEENLADVYLIAPGEHTASIQEAHMVIYHHLCFSIESGLIASGYAHWL